MLNNTDMKVVCILKPTLIAPESEPPIVQYGRVYNVIFHGASMGIGEYYEFAEHINHGYNIGMFIPLDSGHIMTIGLIFLRHKICPN